MYLNIDIVHIYFSCSGAVVTDRAAVQPRRQQSKPAPSPTLTCSAIQPHVALVCRLIVFTFVIHLPTTEDGRLSWPGWLTHSGQFTHKVNSRSGTGHGKFAGQRPTS